MGAGAEIGKAFISMAGQVGQGLVGSLIQRKENRTQRDFEREMYQRQYDDNLKFWNMENQYNTPAMQMQRMKDAGLNPNLMYGSPQSGGNAGSINSPTQTASNSTRTSNPLGNLDIASAINQVYDLRIKSATADNLEAQAKTQGSIQTLNAVSTELKRLEQVKLRTSNQYDISTLEKRINLLEKQYDKTLLEMDNTRADTRLKSTQSIQNTASTQKTIDDNTRAWQHQKLSLQQAVENIKNTQASTQERQANLGLTAAQTWRERSSAELNDFDRWLAKQGYNRYDSGVQRVIKQFFNDLASGKPITSAISEMKSVLDDLQPKKR